jgi:hypothetical protein
MLVPCPSRAPGVRAPADERPPDGPAGDDQHRQQRSDVVPESSRHPAARTGLIHVWPCTLGSDGMQTPSACVGQAASHRRQRAKVQPLAHAAAKEQRRLARTTCLRGLVQMPSERFLRASLRPMLSRDSRYADRLDGAAVSS